MKWLSHERAMLYASYMKIATAGGDLTDAFYQRLFEEDPALQSLFKSAIRDQGVKWRLMLNNIVATIDRPDVLRQTLGELGKRHIDYGVKDEDYLKLVEAFLWAVQQYLGPEFTPQLEAAWRKLLGQVVEYATHPAADE